MNDIPLADILAFGVIAACIVMSMIRGVIAEAGSLFAWVISFLLAKTFAVPFSEVAFKSIQPRALGVAISFVVIFFLARFLQQFLRTILTNAASSMGLGSVNRVLGGVFGAAKGVLLVTLAVMVCAHTDLPETEDWQSSYSIPYFQSLSEGQVKFMMVDPKMVELSVYNDIPHLLIPVVTNPRKASKALQKVVDEMENRYELFAKVGVRNIAGFNAKVEEFNAQSEYKQVPLPLIVVIVDELADLMMVASKEVEDAIIRLGQKARAAGIHMILATQRPSVDVISGLIKANVPSRVAFAVSSGTDSRTILDENGAEKLLGRGDMLFKPIDENHPVRLQGSFISDDDVERIVNFIKAQADADYDESFDPGEVSETEGDFGSSDDAGDPLFEEAKALVIETQKASASMIQRRLSVGFNRATRLMEELEMAGVIGPAEGTKPRKVLQQ